MRHPEKRSFDRTLSLSYPENYGLFEFISENERIIAEPVPFEDPISEILRERFFPLFPTQFTGDKRNHIIPIDTRDLTTVIRLGYDQYKVHMLGKLLGIKLVQIKEASGMLPQDTILPRFAVHSQSANSILDSGIDLKPLPPFINFSQNETLTSATELVLNDLIAYFPFNEEKIDSFIEGLEDGINWIS